MNQSEWDEAVDPEPMLEFLRGKASRRKMILFAVACCRRIWHLIPQEASRRAVEAGEQFAEGRATEADRLAAHDAANLCCFYVDGDSSASDRLEGFAAEAALCTVAGDYPPIPTFDTTCAIAAARTAGEVVAAAAEQSVAEAAAEAASIAAYHQERITQCALVREIFGNPFRTPIFGMLTESSPAVQLARRIADEQAFQCMPELAILLEQAGIQVQAALAHCRSDQPHLRGCWLIDAILNDRTRL